MPVVVVMGVSASGKSQVGMALARRLNVRWQDGDDLHPPENVAKMARGEPLRDADRWVWLDRIGSVLADASRTSGAVVACSALRRVYRDRLRAAAPGVVFVHLHGDRPLLMSRAQARQNHFMPASLLDSQIRTLEPLEPDEEGLTLNVASSVEVLADQAETWVAGNGRS